MLSIVKNKFIVSFFILLIACGVAVPQGKVSSIKPLDRKIKSRTQELEKAKKELEEFRRKLAREKKREKDLLTRLSNTEKEIMLIEKVVNQLKEEQKYCEKEIEKSRVAIQELNAKLCKLKESFARRAVYLYKNGRENDLELILTSRSLNEAIYRYKYLKILSEIDRRNIKAIKENVQELNRKKRKLEIELTKREKILKEKEDYQNKLRKIKKSREYQLAKARKNKRYLIAKIKEKERAIKELQSLIASLEKERKRRQEELDRQRKLAGMYEANPFYSMKGNLIWPVEGEIVTRFGLQKHPRLKTITENPGIDIKAQKGAPVRAVLDGVVTTITYIRGFGNTIILDHGSGFYTVYTHVDEVYVSEKQYVRTGAVIATVGDTGSLQGALLHFEVWKNKTKLNPEEWLARKS